MKLRFKIPIFPGVTLEEEKEVSINILLEKIKESKVLPKEHKTKWIELSYYFLNNILSDRFNEGDSKGGWGISYQKRWLPLLYPKGTPADSSSQPDSISATSMVIYDISNVKSIPFFSKDYYNYLYDNVFNIALEYLKKRYDFRTGGCGTLNRISSGDLVPSPNLRHTNYAFKMWSLFPGCTDYIRESFRFFDNEINNTELTQKRPVDIAPLLNALYNLDLKYNDLFSQQELEDIKKHIIKVKSSLVALYSHKEKGWFYKSDTKGTFLWYTILVLNELLEIGIIKDDDLNNCFNESIEMLLEECLIVNKDYIGMPLKKGLIPDIGMSAFFLKILALKPEKNKCVKNTIKGLSSFITKIADNRNNIKYLEYTFPWSISAIFPLLAHCYGK